MLQTETFEVIAKTDLLDENGCLVVESGEKIKIEATKLLNKKVNISVKKPYTHSQTGIFYSNLTKNEALILFKKGD